MLASALKLHLNHQRGAALIVSMVMLLVITVIGIAVMGGSRLELLMANNSQFQSDAFRNSEIAMQAGIASIPAPLPTAATPIDTLPPGKIATNPADWTSFTSTPAALPAGATGTGNYVVEYLGCSEYKYTPPTVTHKQNSCLDDPLSYVFEFTYRVWSLGTDANGATRILQEVRTITKNTTGDTTLWPETMVLDTRVEIP